MRFDPTTRRVADVALHVRFVWEDVLFCAFRGYLNSGRVSRGCGPFGMEALCTSLARGVERCHSTHSQADPVECIRNGRPRCRDDGGKAVGRSNVTLT